MRQETGSNHLLHSNSEISIQIYRGGFSVVYPPGVDQSSLYYDALDLDTLSGVIAEYEGRVGQVVFFNSQVTLVPLELFEMTSPWEHLVSAGIASAEGNCYAQQLEGNNPIVVVWSVEPELASLLEGTLDVTVTFSHALGLVLQQISPFEADAVLYRQDDLSIVLHYGNGRLLNYLALEGASDTDLLYCLGRFEQNNSMKIETVELLGDCSSELRELISRYYGAEHVKKD